ncbi:hypothetical protein TrLO_g589 [Triparma laevis f. longispina]|uniref:Uncharacterized protein n=1 Tax=Triparma laevis f. longispina TaxID=1714387 RepID=A0A9W7E0T7_9STRA|nr:hypothetical protein TrLO_g589 [Triparma laevis f. longispina]
MQALCSRASSRYTDEIINPKNRLKKSTPFNPLSNPDKIAKLSNGFIPKPPKAIPEDSKVTWRIQRTEKEKGVGFYKIYTDYKSSSNRIYTTVTVCGDVVDFCRGFEAMILNGGLHSYHMSQKSDEFVLDPEFWEEVLKKKKARREWLEDVKPIGGGEFRVKVRGRWKKEIEEWIWGMGM